MMGMFEDQENNGPSLEKSNTETRKQWSNAFIILKETDFQPTFPYPLSINCEGGIKLFSEKHISNNLPPVCLSSMNYRWMCSTNKGVNKEATASRKQEKSKRSGMMMKGKPKRPGQPVQIRGAFPGD